MLESLVSADIKGASREEILFRSVKVITCYIAMPICKYYIYEDGC